MIAARKLTIVKARIGVFSNESRCLYPSPFFARGVGFGLSMSFPDKITCGDIYLDTAAAAAAADHDGPRVTPAFCKIYIQ